MKQNLATFLNNYLYCEEGIKSLYNSNGQLVWEKSASKINIEDVPEGIYILKSNTQSEKFISLNMSMPPS